MREIKFRCWDALNDEWLEYKERQVGWLCPTTGDYKPLMMRVFATKDGEAYNGLQWCLDNFPNFIVEQYTGLKDKNGVEIYEGDLMDFCVFDCFDHDKQYRGVVVYSGSRFMLWKSPDDEFYGNDGGFDLDWVLHQDDEFEVIGNIHQHPELLK